MEHPSRRVVETEPLCLARPSANQIAKDRSLWDAKCSILLTIEHDVHTWSNMVFWRDDPDKYPQLPR